MALETTLYDTADYLETEEDIKYYWEAIVECVMDEPELLIVGLGNIARATANMSQLSRDVNVTRESLYKSLSENGNPSFITVINVMKSLRLNFHGTQPTALVQNVAWLNDSHGARVTRRKSISKQSSHRDEKLWSRAQ